MNLDIQTLCKSDTDTVHMYGHGADYTKNPGANSPSDEDAKEEDLRKQFEGRWLVTLPKRRRLYCN